MDRELSLATDSDLEWCVAHEPSFDRGRLADGIRRGDALIAWLEGRRIGYCRLDWLWSKVPLLAMVRVEESHRGQGVGRGLLGGLRRRLIEEGHPFLLSPCQENESGPRRWHEHMGFYEVGTLRAVNLDGSAEVFLRLDVGARDT